MDLLVEKSNVIRKLSDYGLWVQDVVDRSPTISTNFRTVQGRNGRINAGLTLQEKTISVVGKVTVPTIQDFEELKDDVNGLVVDTEPFYITKMLPESDELYQFENPGENNGDLDLINIPHVEYKYRWKVLIGGLVDWVFLGRHEGGLLFEFNMEFMTEGLPYGETNPETLEVDGSIEYQGTAPNSQLEFPWKLRLTASQNQSGSFYVRIGTRNYTFERQTGIQEGDVIIIDGISTYLNDSNVTHFSNYEHFVLRNGTNEVVTNFTGIIEVTPFIEFYV